jgi:glutamine phosphoribosylpyrophosphate amidotransferase
MCEHFIARAAEPFRLADLWPFAAKLERYGMAGFGWGAAWVEPGRALGVHRDTRAFRDDPGAEAVGDVETTSVLVHLRRPSKLSTMQLADTQPFADPAGRFAFSHNGDLRRHAEFRPRYAAAGRISGRADTEVGARWLEDAWDDCPTPGDALRALHATFQGKANLATIDPAGDVVHYAGNDENPVFAFRLGRIGVVATALYSIDRSLFQLVVPEATERRLARPGVTLGLDPNGTAIAV